MRGGDIEWKISAQMAQVRQSYIGQTGGEGYGENCQVPPVQPEASAEPQTHPAVKSPGSR